VELGRELGKQRLRRVQKGKRGDSCGGDRQFDPSRIRHPLIRANFAKHDLEGKPC
jgi:hypothetical protein